MQKIMLPCAIAAVTLVAQFPIFAQPTEATSVSSGRQTATTLCGPCHEISGKTKVGPGFEDIANLPSTTAISLKAFLRSNYSNMSNFIISSADTDDVIAHILSLKRK